MTETLTPTQPKKGRYNNRPRRAGKEGPAGPGDQSLRRAALIAGSALLGVTVLAAYAYVAEHRRSRRRRRRREDREQHRGGRGPLSNRGRLLCPRRRP